jgi:hypothetical protein
MREHDRSVAEMIFAHRKLSERVVLEPVRCFVVSD